jgi:hypothetical protein
MTPTQLLGIAIAVAFIGAIALLWKDASFITKNTK